MSYKSVFNIMKNTQWRTLFLKLWKYVIVAVGIPTAVFVCVFSLSYISKTLKEFEDVFAVSSYKSAENFKEYIGDFFYESGDITQEKELLDFFETKKSRRYIDDIITYTNLNNTLRQYLNKYDILDSVFIYSIERNEIVSSYRTAKLDEEFEKTVMDKCLANNIKCSLFQNIISGSSDESEQKKIITVSFPIHTFSFDEIDGVLAFNIDSSALANEIFYSSDKDSASVRIVTGDGNDFFVSGDDNSNNEKLQQYALSDILERTKGKDYIIDRQGFDIYCCVSDADFDFAMIFSAGEASERSIIAMLVRIGTTVLLLSILAMVILSYVISKMLFDFMIAVVYEFGIYDINDAKEVVDQKYLGRRFFAMMKKDSKIEKDFVSKINQLRDTQVLALQTQINPHFIFNTLNLVNLMIIQITKKDCTPARVVSLLSDILHYSLSTEEFTTTIEEELSYAQKYIEIEKLKRDDSFAVITDIDETLLRGRTVKFSLQPILENCITHAFNDEKNCSWQIVLKIFKEDSNIHIIIKDNGDGAPEEKIRELNDSFKNIDFIKRGRHIGLTNVNHRLKLIFGDDTVMKVFNDDDGFVVDIIQPFEL